MRHAKFVTRRLTLALLFAGTAPAFPQIHDSPQTPPPQIRVTVNRVDVPVTVTSSGGHIVEHLRREDFQIFDNGVEQPITDFASVEQSTQVVLLIESGPAVLFLAKEHVLAADAFLRSIPPADSVAIASYTRTPELILGFTTDKLAARQALQELSFVNGFGDLNLSASVVSTIDWISAVPGKKTVVLLSTGVDTSPPETWAVLQNKLQASDVRIFSVSLSSDIRQPARMKKLSPQDRSDRAEVRAGFAQADQSLHDLSDATGGRVYFPQTPVDFARAYDEIAQLVANEYSLAFAPTTLDGQLHKLEVRVKDPTSRVDHRQSYLAPTP
jgi:Ca-activated chloride channel family protein